MDVQHIVYVKTDDKGRITAVNSREFIADTTGWTRIDEGCGDRFHHAQAHYLPLPLFDERGICRYRLDGITVVERTQEEMDADYTPMDIQTDGERITALEEQNIFLTECLLEISTLVYA